MRADPWSAGAQPLFLLHVDFSCENKESGEFLSQGEEQIFYSGGENVCLLEKLHQEALPKRSVPVLTPQCTERPWHAQSLSPRRPRPEQQAGPRAKGQARDSDRWGLRSGLRSLLGQAGTCPRWLADVERLQFARHRAKPGEERVRPSAPHFPCGGTGADGAQLGSLGSERGCACRCGRSGRLGRRSDAEAVAFRPCWLLLM